MCTASATVTILYELGLHARPAMKVQDTAKRFESTVTVRRTDNDKTADATNMMALLALMLLHGTEIEVAAEGPDASGAVAEIVQLIESGFEM